jgi:hypothetical protein
MSSKTVIGPRRRAPTPSHFALGPRRSRSIANNRLHDFPSVRPKKIRFGPSLARASVRIVLSTRIAIVLGVTLVTARVEAAARSLTLVGVSGPEGEAFARKISDDLGELYEVVPGRVYRAEAELSGMRGASPEEVRAVAHAIRADAVIGGAIVGSGRQRHLLMAVRDGRTGRVIARGRYDLGSHTLPLIREQVVRDLVRVLERVGAKAVAEEEPPVEEPKPGESVEPTPELAVVEHRGPRAEVSPGVFAGVGYTVMTRRLSFDLSSAPGLNGGTLSGVRADGAVFPLALSAELAQDHPVLASFGLYGSYEHIFTFTSTANNTQSRGHASHWLVLLVGRIPLGHESKGGNLQIESGYQELDWSHESQLDARVPDVTYQAIDLGLGWDRALGTPRLVGALRLAYLAVLDAGGITAASQYGSGSGWGVEAEGSLTTWPLRWLWVRLDARYSVVGMGFVQNGTRFAHSSTDHWFGGTLEVGFAL